MKADAEGRGTGDDTVYCGICEKATSVAMIAHHLIEEHGIDPEEIANAPVIDATGAVLGLCVHGVDLDHDFCPHGCRV